MPEDPSQLLRIHSDALAGHENPDCVIPHCESCMVSTGWLVYRAGPLQGWYMEFQCPDHGQQLTMGGKWKPFIDAALGERGVG